MRINGTIKYLEDTSSPTQSVFGDVSDTDINPFVGDDRFTLAFENTEDDKIYIQNIAQDIINVNINNNKVFVPLVNMINDDYIQGEIYNFYIDVPDDLFDEEEEEEQEDEEEEEQEEEISTYEKKDNYPSYAKPGVYPPGSTKELGLDNSDLENFSLGNWNSIFSMFIFFTISY